MRMSSSGLATEFETFHCFSRFVLFNIHIYCLSPCSVIAPLIQDLKHFSVQIDPERLWLAIRASFGQADIHSKDFTVAGGVDFLLQSKFLYREEAEARVLVLVTVRTFIHSSFGFSTWIVCPTIICLAPGMAFRVSSSRSHSHSWGSRCE